VVHMGSCSNVFQELNIAVEDNAAENARVFDSWLKTHTAEQIRLANSARRRLFTLHKAKQIRIQSSTTKSLPDPRQIKRSTSAYTHYYLEKTSSGAFKGIRVTEASKLASAEYKALSSSEKKVNISSSL
jgi:hypothetical protein